MTILNTLLSITIYSAVIYAAVLLFRLIFKKHVSPSMSYFVWLLLLARLLLPITPDSGFSLITIPQAHAAIQPQVSQTAAPEASDMTIYNTFTEDSGLYTGNNALNTVPVRQQTTAQESTQSASTPYFPAVLISVWILGMLLMSVHTVTGAVKLRIKFRKDSVPIPEEWLDIAKKVKDELNVRGSVKIVLIRNFVSPALVASIFPTIVMPEQMYAKDDEKIEFALRHEMTHLKRKDHIVCLLLTALKIIYWFNPVMWLAFGQIKTDMETACDSAAVKTLNRGETKRYALTVLEMYSKENLRYVLGMSLWNTKKTAERRLRGIFARRRSGRGAKAAAVLLAAILLFACFTTACQPVEGKTVIESDTGQAAIVSVTPQETAQPTPTPTATATADPNDWRVKFADKLSSDGQVHTQNTATSWTYQSANVDVNITKNTDNGVVYFVTDIYVADIKYFRTSFGDGPDKEHTREFVSDALKNVNGIVGINGDLYPDNEGLTIRNGQFYNYKKTSNDELVMYTDGTMEAFASQDFDYQDIEAKAPDKVWQVWGFGPTLLYSSGQPLTKFNSTDTIYNPRTAIGYYEPGHYCFVTVEGRQVESSPGMKIAQLAQLMSQLGCKAAFNLYGGGSSQLAFQGKDVSTACSDKRSVWDIIYVTDEG